MASNTIQTPLSERQIGDEKGILPFLNKEVIPLLREMRKALNSMLEPVVETVTAAHTMTDEGVVEYTGAGGITITLPAADDVEDRSRARYVINNGTGAVTLAAATGDTVNGTTSIALEFGACATLVCNGNTKWSASDGIPSTSFLAGVSPRLSWGRNVVITAGVNVLAMGWNILHDISSTSMLFGSAINDYGGSNNVHGTSVNLGTAGGANDITHANVMGKDVTVTGPSVGVASLGNSNSFPNGVNDRGAWGRGLTVSHQESFVVGRSGSSDVTEQLKYVAGTETILDVRRAGGTHEYRVKAGTKVVAGGTDGLIIGAARAATPTTLAEVITILQTFGLAS